VRPVPGGEAEAAPVTATNLKQRDANHKRRDGIALATQASSAAGPKLGSSSFSLKLNAALSIRALEC
jgi:hypothetical protein